MGDLGKLFWLQWPELIFLVLMVVGVAVSFSIQNPYIGYAVIFASGLMAGKLYFSKQGKQPLFPFFLISIGFLVGFVIGSVRFNRRIIILLFVLGYLAGYYIHKEGYLD